jgi:hypothetical protein
MTIKDGNVASADDVLNNLVGLQFKNWAQMLYNTSYEDWNTNLNNPTSPGGQNPQFKNIDYLTFEAISSSILSNSTEWEYSEGGMAYGPCGTGDEDDNTLDDFEDGTISATLWSTAGTGTYTIDEDDTVAGMLYLTCSDAPGGGSNSTAQCIGLVDGSCDFFGKKAVIIDIPNIYSANVSNVRLKLKWIKNDNSAGTATFKNQGSPQGSSNTLTDYRYKMVAEQDSSDTKVRIHEDPGTGTWDNDLGTFSLEDFSKNLVFFFDLTASAPSGEHTSVATIHVESITYDDWDTSNELIGTIYTEPDSATILNCIPTFNTYEPTGTSIAYSMSADNGSNYESSVVNELQRFTNTGTQIGFKAVATGVEGTNHVSGPKSPKITEYAVLYNVGAGGA